MEARLRKLVEGENFQELRNYVSSQRNVVNVFEAAGMGSQEIRHSHFLAWMLDPRESHGLKDAFVVQILATLFSRDDALHDCRELENCELEDSRVVRETENNIDILFCNSEAQLVICIENKIWAGVSNHQLDKYYEYVEEKYRSYKHRLYVLLTPEGYSADEALTNHPKNWQPLSYEELLVCLKNATATSANERIKMLVEDYSWLLEREGIVINKEVQSKIDEIYSEYRDVFDYIYSNKSLVEHAVIAHLKEIYGETLLELGNEGRIIPRSSYDGVGSYIGFDTTQMNEYLGHDKTFPGSWNTGRRYTYWIYPPLLEPTIRLELGSLGQPEDTIIKMQRIKDFARGNKKQIRSSDRYNIVKTIITGINECSTESLAEIDSNTVRKEIIVAIEKMLEFERKFFLHIGRSYER